LGQYSTEYIQTQLFGNFAAALTDWATE